MKKKRTKPAERDNAQQQWEAEKPTYGFFVDGEFVSVGEALPDIGFPKIVRLLERRVILDDRAEIVLPYTRRTLKWLLAQVDRWADEGDSDELRERLFEILQGIEEHYIRWQPK